MLLPEIIPNWHPVFVHFTIGLLAMSALFYVIGSIFKKENLIIAARWNLWAGAVVTVGTVAAGFYAYNTVAHDGDSHAAMTDHRNWALFTAAVFMVLALWSVWKQRRAKSVHPAFVVIMVLSAGLLAVTGYKGGELVYRHGTGVMSLPDVQGANDGHEGHDHGDASANPQTNTGNNRNGNVETNNGRDHSAHNH